VKFLCEHCKAKYQIADDKVAGRTVRMKCRKCGNAIEVRAAVTETSVSRAPPAGRGATVPMGGGIDPAKAYAAAAAGKPGGGLATSLSGARSTATRPLGASVSPQKDGALAGAFQRNVQKEDEASAGLDLHELSAADEWYVAINGVPVGPVRVAELRRKAALSVVTEESLCWQEGMEEWRPVRAVTALAAVVREAASGGRVSLISPAPTDARVSAPPPPRASGATQSQAPRPTAPPGSPGTGASQAPASLGGAGRGSTVPAKPAAPVHATAAQAQSSQVGARSNVVPISAANNNRLATAEKLDEQPFLAATAPAPMIAADPFALPKPAAFPDAQPSPFQAVAPAPAPVAVAPAVLQAQPKKSPPWILLAMFVLAAAFGITAAIMMFKQPQQVVVVAPPPTVASPPPSVAVAPPATVGVDIPTADSAAVAAPSASAVAVAANGKPPTGGTAPHGPSTTAPKPGPTTAADPALQELIRQNGGGSGPSATPGAGAAGGGPALTEAQVGIVLAQHKVGVSRTCWERSSGSTPTANIDVKISVGASGAVQSAQATGNDPVVAHCIESAIRSWQFPPSGGVSTINVPFHFVRQ